MAKTKKAAPPPIDRMPPQATEEEMAVLGSIMIDHDAMCQCSEIIKPEHFYDTVNQKIYSAALELFNENVKVDYLTLCDKLESQNILEEVGGAYTITQYTEAIPSAANVEHYAKIVVKKGQLRNLIRACNEIQVMAYDQSSIPDQVVEEAQKMLMDITFQNIKSASKFEKVLSEALENISTFHKERKSISGIPSGIVALDKITGGFKKKDLVIIAGRPSMGKSALAMNNIGLYNKNMKQAWLSMEMSENSIAMRAIASKASINFMKMTQGKLRDSEFAKISMNISSLADMETMIDDRPSMSITEMKATLRKIKIELAGLDIVFVDYLQLAKATGYNRENEIAQISQGLKAIAKEFDVCVIALSQLSRACETRSSMGKPILSDLRESGQIEQDADVVMFVWRPEVYDIDTTENAEIIVAKHRNGAIGPAPVWFKKESMTFHDVEKNLAEQTYKEEKYF